MTLPFPPKTLRRALESFFDRLSEWCWKTTLCIYHFSPILMSLYWLTVKFRFTFKILLLTRPSSVIITILSWRPRTTWPHVCLFQTVLCKQRWLFRKIPVDQQFVKYSDRPSAPRAFIQSELQQADVTMSTCLKSMSFCYVIGWLDV